MKNIYFERVLCIVSVFCFVLTIEVTGQTVIKKDAITYSFVGFETPGVGERDSKKDRVHKHINETFHQLRRDNVHPALFEYTIAKTLDKGVDIELMCVIDGDIKNITNMFQKEGVCTWVWKKIDWSKVCIKVELSPTGLGMVTLIQNESVVGNFGCHSSNNRVIGSEGYQPFGEYTLSARFDKDIKHINHEGTVMENARCFDVDRGLFIHLGQINTQSGGCLRVSRWWSDNIFKNAPKNLKINIFWLK